MLFFLLAVLFVSLVGNMLISMRYKTHIFEYLLLSVIIGPFSWMVQMRKVRDRQANGNL
jgi:hypothetical protein